MFTREQVLNCLDSAVQAWGEKLVMENLVLNAFLKEDTHDMLYTVEGRHMQLSRKVFLLYNLEVGRVFMSAVSEGSDFPISVCRPKEIFHQMFWKIRCSLVETGAIPNTMYPSAEVLDRFNKLDLQYAGERLRSKLELATAFAFAEMN